VRGSKIVKRPTGGCLLFPLTAVLVPEEGLGRLGRLDGLIGVSVSDLGGALLKAPSLPFWFPKSALPLVAVVTTPTLERVEPALMLPPLLLLVV
jgi:hypothetical protein